MPELDYSRVIGRVFRLAVGLVLIGGLVLFTVQGWRGLLSFLGGAAVSALSFWLLHRQVSDLTSAGEGRPVSGPSMVLHLFRILILGGATYAIVNTYGALVPALACGLLTTVAAATLEVLIELFYART